MRINLYLASATGLSRRAADKAIEAGQVTINARHAVTGDQVTEHDVVSYKGQPLSLPEQTQTIMLNKPVGYVCSRDGQGSQTVYDLLPAELHYLKPVGRLDKDSSGLLLLTSDGELAHHLTHPSFRKQKIYQLGLNKPLSDADHQKIEKGVELEDGFSRLNLKGQGTDWTVTMTEGRNRQIRRTFEAIGYKIKKLHRTQFGDYRIAELESGKYKVI